MLTPRTLSAALLVGAIAAGCNCGGPVPDASKASVTVDRADGVVADGTDAVTITVTVQDSGGQPIPNAEVTVSASGEGNTLGAAPATDEAGKSVVKLSSTRAETKTLSVSLRANGAAVDLAQHPTVTFVAGAASKLAFAVPPSTAQAGAALVPAVQVAVQDPNGNVVAAATALISLTLGGGDAAATLGGTTEASAVSGTATFEGLTVDRAATLYTLTAAAEGLAPATSAPFEITVGPPARLTFDVEPSTTVAGQVITPAVAVAIRDAEGNLATSGAVEVTLALAENPGQASLGGALTATAVNGVATFAALTLDKAAAQYRLAATAPGLGGALSGGFDVTAAAPDQGESDLSAAPASVVADGTTVTELTATVRDGFGNPVSGRTVTFTATGTANALTPASGVGTTDAAGSAKVLLASTVAESKVVSAEVDGAFTLQLPVVFTAGEPDAAASQLAAAPTRVTADGVATTTLTVAVADAHGNPVANAPVTLSATGSANAFAPPVGSTDAAGVFTATLASTRAEVKTIAAAVAGFELTTTVSFVPGAPSPATSTLAASPTSVTADGTSTTALTLTALDAQGNVIPNAAVTLSSTGSANTFAPPAGTTDAAGVFTATLASTRAELKTVTATVGGVPVSAAVTFVPGAPSSTTTTLDAAPASLVADGTGASNLVLTVRDAQGNLVPGAPVAFAVSGTANVLTPASGATDGGGVFSATLTSTTAEAKTVTATAGPATATAQVTFEAGPADAFQSSLASDRPSAPANGTAPITLTVTVRDAYGNLVAGEGLTLTVSGTGNDLVPASGVSDATGRLVATLTSTTAEVKTVTAALASGGSTELTVSFLFPQVTFTTCGQLGRLGPSQAQCDAAYAGTPLSAAVTVTGGIQSWTVPLTGTYRIEALGAQGGAGGTGTTGGAGARIRGDVALTQGQVLKVLVGQEGGTQSAGGGGGGGTFVVLADNTPLVIAGGGGGGNGPYSTRGAFDGGPGLTGTSGGDSNQPLGTYGAPAPGPGGGAIGRGGGNGYGGGGAVASGGGGLYDRGGVGSHVTTAGAGFLQGGEGAPGNSTNHGGFGGGGGGQDSSGYGGGGGGYSGGGAGNWDQTTHGNGGGGGSYNAGTNQEGNAGFRTGSGQVTIELL